LNNTECISVLQGEANVLSNYTQQFDVFIANIQKSIIMRDVPEYVKTMKHGALLLVSGFFTPDLDDVKTCFSEQGLQFVTASDREGWCCATFRKP
jgi:ribosomal protein L11 methyltransferase